jgi:hypothetical protein
MVQDWGGKLAGATLRLSAVLHCAENSDYNQIGKQSIDAAIEIANYLVPHAGAVLRMMEADANKREADAQYVLRWILRHGRKEFVKRDAQQHGRSRFPNATDIDGALTELEERNYIRQVPKPTAGPGRPPSPYYEVNPQLVSDKENASHDLRSVPSQTAASHRHSEHCEHALPPVSSHSGREGVTDREFGQSTNAG